MWWLKDIGLGANLYCDLQREEFQRQGYVSISCPSNRGLKYQFIFISFGCLDTCHFDESNMVTTSPLKCWFQENTTYTTLHKCSKANYFHANVIRKYTLITMNYRRQSSKSQSLKIYWSYAVLANVLCKYGLQIASCSITYGLKH